MTTKSATAKPKNDAFAAIHSAAKGLHSVGAINKTTMREYDALCLDSIPKFKALFANHVVKPPRQAP